MPRTTLRIATNEHDLSTALFHNPNKNCLTGQGFKFIFGFKLFHQILHLIPCNRCNELKLIMYLIGCPGDGKPVNLSWMIRQIGLSLQEYMEARSLLEQWGWLRRKGDDNLTVDFTKILEDVDTSLMLEQQEGLKGCYTVEDVYAYNKRAKGMNR